MYSNISLLFSNFLIKLSVIFLDVLNPWIESYVSLNVNVLVLAGIELISS